MKALTTLFVSLLSLVTFSTAAQAEVGFLFEGLLNHVESPTSKSGTTFRVARPSGNSIVLTVNYDPYPGLIGSEGGCSVDMKKTEAETLAEALYWVASDASPQFVETFVTLDRGEWDAWVSLIRTWTAPLEMALNDGSSPTGISMDCIVALTDEADAVFLADVLLDALAP